MSETFKLTTPDKREVTAKELGRDNGVMIAAVMVLYGNNPWIILFERDTLSKTEDGPASEIFRKYHDHLCLFNGLPLNTEIDYWGMDSVLR